MPPVPPRSVKISEDERGGWTSDRPRRPGEPERPPRLANVSVRGRVMAPSDRLRYSPGSLLLVSGPDAATVEHLLARVLQEQGALLSIPKLSALLAGRVPDQQIPEKAHALLDAAAKQRLAAGQTVVIALEGLDAAEREHFVRMAAEQGRPRHFILVEAPKEAVDEDDRRPLADLRTRLDAGELAAEGFVTSLRLGGRTAQELNRIVFARPPADD